jgi:hypothetical protein
MDRRAALTATAGLAFAAAVTPAQAKPALDVSTTLGAFQAYARMRGVTPQKLGLWWYAGLIHVQREGEVLVPFLKVEGFSFNRIQVTPDGKLDQVLAEAGYFKDVETEEILSDWTNPLTGLKVKPKHYKLVQHILADEISIAIKDTNMQPMSTHGRIGPAMVSGDIVWVGENFSNKYEVPQREGRDPMEYAGQFIVGSSLATFESKLSDLADAKKEFVPATLSYQSLSGYMSWLRMGREKGLINWQLFGRKLRTMDEAPKSLLARLDADYPGWLADPKI